MNDRRKFLTALALFPVGCLGIFSRKEESEYLVDDDEPCDKKACQYLVNLTDGRCIRYPIRYGIPKGFCTLNYFAEAYYKYDKNGFKTPNEMRKLNSIRISSFS